MSGAPGGPGREQRAYLGIRRWRDRVLSPLAGGLGWLRIPAWAVSVLGMAAAMSTLWTTTRAPALALLGFALALLADAADGAVARFRGTASSAGKWVDHVCDTGTFTALVAAAALHGLASPRIALFAFTATVALFVVALAVARRRDPAGFREHPRAGFLAHFPRLFFYVAFPLALAGGPRWVEPALGLVGVVSAAVVVSLGVRAGLGRALVD